VLPPPGTYRGRLGGVTEVPQSARVAVPARPDWTAVGDTRRISLEIGERVALSAEERIALVFEAFENNENAGLNIGS